MKNTLSGPKKKLKKRRVRDWMPSVRQHDRYDDHGYWSDELPNPKKT